MRQLMRAAGHGPVPRCQGRVTVANDVRCPSRRPSIPRPGSVQTAADLREGFARNRRVMSFGEYFTLFFNDRSARRGRPPSTCATPSTTSAPRWCARPRGPVTRWKLFDCPWDDGKDHLMGQEEVQASVYRLVSNFAREGRTNRLILLHGPNGSAKSTFVACLQRALEHYSTSTRGRSTGSTGSSRRSASPRAGSASAAAAAGGRRPAPSRPTPTSRTS